MSHKAIRRTIIAAFFVATLALTGTSEAGGLFTTTPASETRIEQGFWAQALDWMSGFWGELTGVSSDKTATSEPPTGSTSTTTASSCTNPAGCEAGWGIDPNG